MLSAARLHILLRRARRLLCQTSTKCWEHWQTLLPLEDIQRLLMILHQPHTPAERASGFKAYFKQVSVARLLETSHAHLVNRIQKNGWAFGPSAEFLAWLANAPVTQVGAVPRYAVLRWSLGEDADYWLPLRGKLSRSQPCLWCQCNTRCFPRGPGHGALCPPCFFPATPRDLALHSLTEDTCAFARFHQVSLPLSCPFPPAVTHLDSSEGCIDAPRVLRQQGVNSIDHWLSFCQVPHLTWLALWTSGAPDLNWRSTPTRSTGVALCYLLFHLRRLVTEYGGLQPVIKCVRIRPISQHVLDLWQRIYRSLPSTLLRHFRAPPQTTATACVESTKIRLQRFPTVTLESCQGERIFWTTRATVERSSFN